MVNLSHTYIGDLVLAIRHGGSTQVLHSREGGSTDNIQKTFTLTSFNGAPVGGPWELLVRDEAGQDVGTLHNWSLVAEL